MWGRRDRDLLTKIQDAALSEDRSVTEALRHCVVLGGRAGSTTLRDWASRELRGYQGEEDVPEYRKVRAPICADGISGYHQFRHMQISHFDLPDFVAQDVSDLVIFPNGIAELEGLAGRGEIKLGLPMSADIARLMTQQRGDGVHYERLYWNVSPVAVRSVVEQVRNRLVELVAELRAGTSEDESIPTTEVTNQAVQVAIHGSRNRVTVSPAMSAAASELSVSDGSSTGRLKVVFAGIGAAGTIALSILAWMQFLG